MFARKVATLTVSGIAVGIVLHATAVQAGPVGLIDTDRFGYTGTIERYDSLIDAQNGNSRSDTINVDDRDLALFVRNGLDDPNYNVAMGSWWYTTDNQGRPGFGNTRGNTGVGFVQLFDNNGSTDSTIKMSFSGFDDTTGYFTEFRLVLGGENANDVDDGARLSAYDNVNDGGIFHSYELELTATGLEGEDSDNDGLIEANDQPGGVTGFFSGIFEIMENETTAANQGFYRFDFELNMTNWAWENRASLTTQDADGNTISDQFAQSTFIAAEAPEPATVALLGAGLAGLGVVARRRR